MQRKILALTMILAIVCNIAFTGITVFAGDDWSGEIPYDEYSGKILFKNSSGKIIYSTETSTTSRMTASVKADFPQDGAHAPGSGSYALFPTLEGAAAGEVYVQYDFGKPISLEMFKVFFRNRRVDKGAYTNLKDYNRVAKSYRIDYTNDLSGEWTQGEVQYNDMSNPAHVGADVAALYNNIKDGTIEAPTDAQLKLLPNSVTAVFNPAITARYARFVLLEPVQDETDFVDGSTYYLSGFSWYLAGKTPITARWNSTEVINNSYGSCAYGKNGASAFVDGANFTSSDSANNAFDGVSTTKWANGAGRFSEYNDGGVLGTRPWVVVNLGAKYHINSLRMLGTSWGTSFDIQVADIENPTSHLDITTATYETVHTVSNPPTDPNVLTDECDFVGQYIRIYFSSITKDVSVKEISLYGTPYVPVEEEFSIDSVSVINDESDLIEDGLVEGEATVTASFTNTLEDGQNVLVMAVLYDKNNDMSATILGMDSKEIVSLATGEDKIITFPINIPENPEDYVFKLFLWEGFGNARPLQQLIGIGEE